MQPNIMIIDSSTAFVMYARLLLKRLGYSVRASISGAEGLKALKIARPDLLIIAAELTAPNGESLARTLAEGHNTAHIPLIIVTVEPSTKEENFCRDLGCIDYLTKPLSLERLHAALLKVNEPNNRRHLRAFFARKIRVYSGGKREDLFASNISEGGLFLRKMTPLPTGTELEMKFQLNDDGDDLLLKGRVIHTMELFENGRVNNPGMAVRFHDLDPDEALALRQYLKAALTQSLSEQQGEKALRL